MKKILLSLLLIIGMTITHSQTFGSEGITGTVSIGTDYRPRGVSASQSLPAIQYGLNYASKNGLYVGMYNTSLTSITAEGLQERDYGDGSGIQSNIYSGYKTNVGPVKLNTGLVSILFVGNRNGTSNNYDTYAVYTDVGLGPVSFKFTDFINNFVGINNTSHSHYYELNFTQPLSDKVIAVTHIGRTSITNLTEISYTDINFGGIYLMNDGWSITGKYHTNKNYGSLFTTAYTYGGVKLYNNTFILSLNKSF